MKKIFFAIALLFVSVAVFAQKVEEPKKSEQSLDELQEQMLKLMEGMQLDQMSPFMQDTSMQWNFMMPFSNEDFDGEEWQEMNKQMSKMMTEMMKQFQNEDFQENFLQFFFNGEQLEPFQLSPEKQDSIKGKDGKMLPRDRKKKKKRTTYSL